jgi:predicted PhzF superfamily epimerase YddE/YHI9
VPSIRYFQVDAFTTELFRGNPAGVCLLEKEWLPDELMQRVAFENNQAETAFVLPQQNYFGLRWFTPTVEIDLCGHATLASAFILFTQCGWKESVVEFESKSGPLKVARDGSHFVLNFPSRPGRPASATRGLLEGLGAEPKEVYQARDWLAVFDSEDDVRAVRPKFDLIAELPGGKTIITAPGREVDFVSRFFAPGVGVNEDPVTGSSHCTLIPYWAARLNKTKLRARQLSQRGGELLCELRGDRVSIGGQAVLYSSGILHL